jgi:MscS family membrane protein
MKAGGLLMGYWHLRAAADADPQFREPVFPIIRKDIQGVCRGGGDAGELDNIGVNITAAIASLSIGGLAVGLAAQDTLANLFGAVAFHGQAVPHATDRSMRGWDGESIGMRST